jgi:hypothetical protein
MAAPAPLPLDSPRWRTLKAHFDNAGRDGDLPSVPTLIARWIGAVGTYGEEYEYSDLRESYLHQGTILDVAYAVVPHLAARLDQLDPDRRVEVLEDLALVELVRLTSPEVIEARIAKVEQAFSDDMREMMVQTMRDRMAPLPADLAPAYLAAIERVDASSDTTWRDLAKGDDDGSDDDEDRDENSDEEDDEGDEVTEPPHPRHWRRHVKYLRDAGWTDIDIAFGFRALRATEPDGMIELVYQGPDAARSALCTLDSAPRDWLERTRLRRPEGELGFRALHSLAYWAALDLATILA